MKKLLYCLAFTTVLSSTNAQTRISNMINMTNGGSASLVEKMGKKESENATGSPYISKSFSLGNVKGVTETIMMKYNAYLDEMEVNNGDDKIFILPKSNEFNEVTFKNTKDIYRFFHYKDKDGKDVSGYLVEKIVANDITLLKREKVILIPEKEAATSYSNYTPPKYERISDDYYLQLKDKRVVAFPKNKKKLMELFPAQKVAVETFLKANDISFKEESDMVRITQFIATL